MINGSISTKLKYFLAIKFWWPLALLGFLFWFGGKALTIYKIECPKESDFWLHITPENIKTKSASY